MAPSDAIALREVSRAYGESLALRDVSVGLAPGETLVVLGPNGAGKSTLLRILATLLRPSAGEVTVLGCELPRQAWKIRGRIGFLGHDPLLYRELTAAENLAFHARLHGLGGGGAARSAELLERVGMGAAAGVRAGEMSAGMRQRVAVCRALLHEPELLLLDEPLAHLDPGAAALVEPLIGAGTGSTRVVVTHDPRAGLAEADQVLALRADGSFAFAAVASGVGLALLGEAYGASVGGPS
ncbi:MAG: ATP-binding cassette domain-containing protein [Solirubrobacterales bacterium]